MSLIEYSPKATAFAARCKPDTLRDWRRLGFLDGIGARNGKGHKFASADVAGLAVANFLARNGASLREAFEIVFQRKEIVDTLTASIRHRSDPVQDYYLTFVISPDAGFPESITGGPVHRIAFENNPIGVLQVNVSQLVRSALERLESFHRYEV